MDEQTTTLLPAQSISKVEWVTKHIALVSAVVSLTAILSSTVFLYGYLSVFDWHLIWIIEYSDVLKFGLVVFAVVTGFFYYISGYVEDAYHLISAEPEKRSWWIKAIILGLFVSFVPRILADETSQEHYYMLHISLHLSAIILMALTIIAAVEATNLTARTGRQIYNLCGLWICALFFFGFTFGYYTRDTSGFRHTVSLKGVEMTNVGVVMITSHHTVLYTQDGDVIVAPTADVSPIILKHQ
jgi:hypothetical protein